MRIEIYIVKTEIDKSNFKASDLKKLEETKEKLLRIYRGLSILPNVKGYWIDNNENIVLDNNEIWLIYTELAYEETREKFLSILAEIKQITKQECLAYALNNTLEFI